MTLAVAADPPVIAIDGPSASGKGTVALHVARELGFHYLDSGSLYRLVALAAMRGGVDLADGEGLWVPLCKTCVSCCQLFVYC